MVVGRQEFQNTAIPHLSSAGVSAEVNPIRGDFDFWKVDFRRTTRIKDEKPFA
jgi:hypothetical protein